MKRKKSRQTPPPAGAPSISSKREIPSWIKHSIVAAALGVVTLLAYSNSFHAGLVIDNRPLILGDPRIREATFGNLDLIFQHSYWWPTGEVGLYRPVTTLSYLFNYALLGNTDQPSGYHFVSFLLHFFNVLLVYALALRLLRKFWPAVFISALWAVHPLLTESVTNIVGRSDLLAAMAILGGFLIYLKSTDSDGWRRYVWLACLLGVTTIGVFSKESAVAILGVIALYEFTFWNERKQLRGLALGCAAVGVPILAMLYQRSKVLAASMPAHYSFVDNPLKGANFVQSRLTAIAVTAKYLWLLVWPAKLSTDYSYSQIPIATGTVGEWVAWIAVAIVIAMLLIQFPKNRLSFFFGMFAFVTFVPVANLLFLTGTIMAERFLYLPAVGFAACLVMTIYAIQDRFRVRYLAPVALCLFIACFAARTWARNLDWQDERTMATASALSSPNSMKAHFGLATLLTKSDPVGVNISQAIEEIEKSIAIVDSLPDSQNESLVYAEAGKDYDKKGFLLVRRAADGTETIPSQSVQAYERSLQLLLRGVAIDQAGAADYRRQLIAAGKDATVSLGTAQLYDQLAITYIHLGQFKNAYDAAAAARLLDPSNVQNYAIMGQTLAVEGRSEEAATIFVEGVLASGTGSLLRPLSILYKSGIDPQGCAISQTPNGLALNPQCAPVHKEACSASAELIQLYTRNGRKDLAETINTTAKEQFGCPATRLE